MVDSKDEKSHKEKYYFFILKYILIRKSPLFSTVIVKISYCKLITEKYFINN